MHIVQRGHDRRPCFRVAADFQHYRRLLRESAQLTSCLVHAYVFMTNHVHLLVTPPNADAIARMMHRVAGVYGYSFNRQYERTGPLWESRYWSRVIDSERHLLACSRYIELNPVRAGMVSDPRGYRWSSYRGNAERSADVLLTPHATYGELGQDEAEQAAAYTNLFKTVIEPDVVDAIRGSPRRPRPDASDPAA